MYVQYIPCYSVCSQKATNTPRSTYETPVFCAGNPASQSTPVKWKEGMNLVGKAEGRQETEASRKRRHGPARTFFQWFLDNTDPSADDIAEVILCLLLAVFFLSSTSTLPATGHTLDS